MLSTCGWDPTIVERRVDPHLPLLTTKRPLMLISPHATDQSSAKDRPLRARSYRTSPPHHAVILAIGSPGSSDHSHGRGERPMSDRAQHQLRNTGDYARNCARAPPRMGSYVR
jgi:hypothetical protein